MQIASLILGIRGIGMVRRSRGRQFGRGLAIAGTIISGTLLVGFGILTAAGAVGVVLDRTQIQDETFITSRLNDLALAQRVYSQMDLSPADGGGDCVGSLTDLLRATQGASPVEDAEGLMAADRGALGAAAKPYHGYFFRMTTRADAAPEDAKLNWVIFAWPAKEILPNHHVLMLEPGTEPRIITTIHGEPPANPTRENLGETDAPVASANGY